MNPVRTTTLWLAAITLFSATAAHADSKEAPTLLEIQAVGEGTDKAAQHEWQRITEKLPEIIDRSNGATALWGGKAREKNCDTNCAELLVNLPTSSSFSYVYLVPVQLTQIDSWELSGDSLMIKGKKFENNKLQNKTVRVYVKAANGTYLSDIDSENERDYGGPIYLQR